MTTVERRISCSCGVVLFAWTSTTYTKEEKAERKIWSDEQIKSHAEAYASIVSRYQADRFKRLRMKKWRKELGIAAYVLEVAKNEHAPFKDDPPKIANLDGVFDVLAAHSPSVDHILQFKETLPNPTA